MKRNGSANDKIKFTGKERDKETGHDYFGARYYDGRIGKFFVLDALRDNPKLLPYSPYHYSYNNPIKFKDPSGLMAEGPDDEKENKAIDRLNKIVENVRSFIQSLFGGSGEAKENAQVAAASAGNIANEVKDGLTEGTLNATEQVAEISGNVEEATAFAGGVSMLGGPTTAPATASLFSISGTAGGVRLVAMTANRMIGGETYTTPGIAMQTLSVASPLSMRIALGRWEDIHFIERIQQLGFSTISIMNRP